MGRERKSYLYALEFEIDDEDKSEGGEKCDETEVSPPLHDQWSTDVTLFLLDFGFGFAPSL